MTARGNPIKRDWWVGYRDALAGVMFIYQYKEQKDGE